MRFRVAFSSALIFAASIIVTEAASADRVVVPINQRINPSSTITYFIELGVEDSSVKVVLDTGSDGLHVLQSAVPNDKVFGEADFLQVYDDGVRLRGVETTGKVSFGSLSQRVPLVLVKTADCDPVLPKCLVAKRPPSAAWWGLQGIVGINLEAHGATVPLANPLQGLADAWIVELPKPGAKAPGQLILNPDDEDLKGFTRFPAGTGGTAGAARDNPIPGCIKNATNGASFCGPIILDTGKPDVYVITNQFKSVRIWPAGSAIELRLGDASTGPLMAKWTEKLAVFPSVVALGPFPELRDQPPTRVLAGQEPFLLFDVLYDDGQAEIGLRPR